jgi:2Fe-2S ferredoxin
MAKLYVTDTNGSRREVEAAPDGEAIVNILINNGYNVGLCGGNCSCGTCHAAIDAAWIGKLAPPRADEAALVGTGIHQGPGTRLTCQIPFVEELDGISFTIIPME